MIVLFYIHNFKLNLEMSIEMEHALRQVNVQVREVQRVAIVLQGK